MLSYIAPLVDVVITIGGSLLAVGMLWIFGSLLVGVVAPDLNLDPAARRLVSLLVAVSLCGLVAMIPARLASSADEFHTAVRWSIPVLLGVFALLTLRRWVSGSSAQSRLIRPRVRVPEHLAAWTCGLSLFVVTAAMLWLRPVPSGRIELSGESSSGAVQVEVSLSGGDAAEYVLVATSPQLDHDLRYGFVARSDGPVTFELPDVDMLTVELQSPEGAVLRRLEFQSN